MSKNCLFFEEYRAMEGMMKFCLNENAYPQEDYKNIFPECENCKFYVSESELRHNIIEEQAMNIKLLEAVKKSLADLNISETLAVGWPENYDYYKDSITVEKLAEMIEGRKKGGGISE